LHRPRGLPIFDLDGTLIDSNDAHLEALLQAFRAEGYAVERDRIALEIGKVATSWSRTCSGARPKTRRGDKLRELQKTAFRERAAKQGLRPFPGAEALLGALAARRLKTALATDVGEVGNRLDEVLRRLSPGTLRLDAAATDHLMSLALREADLALEEGNVPIGAVLASSDGEVLCSAHNEVLTRGDRTAHAELNAFRGWAKADGARQGEPLYLYHRRTVPDVSRRRLGGRRRHRGLCDPSARQWWLPPPS